MNLEEIGIDDGKVVEAAKGAVAQGKELVPWLPDPKKCDYCGSYCRAETQHVDTSGWVGYRDVWQCPNSDCGARYFRERV